MRMDVGEPVAGRGHRFRDRFVLVSSRFCRNSEKAVVLGFWFNRFLLDNQVSGDFSSQKKGVWSCVF